MLALISSLVLLLGGCGDDPTMRRAVAPQPASEALRWGRQLVVEENTDVINVAPLISLDPRGGFLVADSREAQLRRYTAEGALLWHAGRKGSGPGEYQSPTVIRRLPSGEILAAEHSTGVVVMYDESGERIVRTMRTPFRRVEDIEVVSDSVVLVGAMYEQLDSPRLHLWNPYSNAIVRSFFDPVPSTQNRDAAAIASWTKASLRGDTIAAIYSLSDTVYLFRADGTRIGEHALPPGSFRTEIPKSPEPGIMTADFARWLASFDYLSDVHWLSDGSLLLTIMNTKPDQAGSRVWHLMKLNRTGELELFVRDSPRLLAVDTESDSLYFISPGSELENRWAVATIPSEPRSRIARGLGRKR